MMRTLLTGFGPFGNVVDNPTARIVAHFAETGAPGHELVSRVLPVAFGRADSEICGLLRTGRFDAALLLGVAGRRRVLSLERLARNRDSASIPDADGELRFDVPIVSDGPESIRSTLKLTKLRETLRSA